MEGIRREIETARPSHGARLAVDEDFLELRLVLPCFEHTTADQVGHGNKSFEPILEADPDVVVGSRFCSDSHHRAVPFARLRDRLSVLTSAVDPERDGFFSILERLHACVAVCHAPWEIRHVDDIRIVLVAPEDRDLVSTTANHVCHVSGWKHGS